MRHLSALVIVLLVLAAAAPADAGELLARGRLIYIAPSESSESILDTGSEVDVDGALAPEIDLVYLFAPHWGLELVVTAAEHDLEASGGAIDGANLGSVWVAPPTLLLQYHFWPDGEIRPYVGAGFTAATFFSYNPTNDIRALGLRKLEFSDSFGPAAGVGVDIDLNENWFFNLDLKFAAISTDVELKNEGVPGFTADTVTVDIDPWIAGIGIGHRF